MDVTLQVFSLRKWEKKIVKIDITSFILSTAASKNIYFLERYERNQIYSVKKSLKIGHVKPKFQYFLNQHSNVYLEKDERQALRTRKHYMLIFSE